MEIGQISKITLPDNTTYNIKDSVARIDINEKIFIDGLSVDSLSLLHISHDDFNQKIIDNATLSNEVYFVSSEYFDAYGQQLKNIALATDLSDAIGLGQLSSILSNEHNNLLSSLSNDGYVLNTNVNIDYVSNAKAIYLSAGSHVTSVDCTDFIKDGMLSTAELCGTTLVLVFNTDAGSDPISVEMSSFVDNYDGKITYLSNSISSLSDAIDERAMLSDIPLSTSQLTNDSDYAYLSDIPLDLSSFTNSPLYVTSSEISADLENIDKKVFIDDRISGIQGYSDLSIIKLSAYEYDQLVADDATLSNNLYIVEDEFEDAYGQQIKNLAPGTDLSDAVNLEQLSNALSDVQIPTDLSAFTNSPGYLVSNDISDYYKKSETSSASEISDAISNAGKGYTVVIRKLDNEGVGNGWCYVGGNQIEAQATILPAGLRIQHVDTSITETSVYNQSFIVVPNGVNSSGYNTVYVNGAAKNNEVIQLTGDTLVELYYLFCFLEGTLVKLEDGTTKKIEDITYDDVLSVWNFDEGHADSAKPLWINEPHVTTYCWETELSSGKKIRTTGIHGHRFFSLNENKFLYADEIAGHKIWTEDGEDVVTSSKLVQGINARFYNIITDKHINIFADGILAGCSLENGLYEVKDMKFVKDDRQLNDFSEFEGQVSREWFDGCRYAESNLSRKYLVNYFQQRNLNFKNQRQLLKIATPTSEPYETSSYINVYKHVLRGLGAGTLSSDAITYQQLQDEVSTMLSTIDLKLEEYSKIIVKDSNVSSTLSALVINNVTQQEYLALSAAGQTVSSELYIIDPDSTNLDARGNWVTNVKTPEISSDAANKEYVDSQLSNTGGGFSFEIYKPLYNSVAQTYVLKPGKFNILSNHINNNDNIILEDYTIDQVYKVQLTGNASTAVSVNLLVDTNAGDVLPGAYSDSSIASCLTKIAPKEIYNFEVSYGNVTFDNDINGDSLRTLYPYGIRPIYGGGYEAYEMMPIDNTCNHLSIAVSSSEYNNKQFYLVMPHKVRINKVRRMRQFSIAFKTEFSERGMELNFPSTDMNGDSLSYKFMCGRQYAKAPKQGDVLTFIEYQKDVLFVDIQNVNKSLWYQFVTPTPINGVVIMQDRCINYINITTTSATYWEWSDGAPNGRNAPYYNVNGDPPQWTNNNDSSNYEIINYDAGPNETILYIYPDPNNHDESTIVVAQKITSYVINSGNGTIAMPPVIPGRCRDFLLRLRIDVSNVPNITFTGANFETESGQFPVLEEGVQILSFTEVEIGTFMIGCKKMMSAS